MAQEYAELARKVRMQNEREIAKAEALIVAEIPRTRTAVPGGVREKPDIFSVPKM